MAIEKRLTKMSGYLKVLIFLGNSIIKSEKEHLIDASAWPVPNAANWKSGPCGYGRQIL